jgi:hypothetical protein
MESKTNDVAAADMTRNDFEKAQMESSVEEKGVSATYETSRAERKVLLKLDAVILPLTALLYVSSSPVASIQH